MAQIINFMQRQRKDRKTTPIIWKQVDGEIVECVNIDDLPPEQQNEYISDTSK